MSGVKVHLIESRIPTNHFPRRKKTLACATAFTKWCLNWRWQLAHRIYVLPPGLICLFESVAVKFLKLKPYIKWSFVKYSHCPSSLFYRLTNWMLFDSYPLLWKNMNFVEVYFVKLPTSFQKDGLSVN